MIILYSGLLLLLGAAGTLFRWRLTRLEKRYARTAQAAEQLARESVFKVGNRLDAYKIAKRQLQLGVIVEKRDRLEEQHHRWLRFWETFDRLVRRLRDWKGKKLPYSFGAVDVACLLTTADYLGFNQYVSGRQVVELVRSWIAAS